MEWERAQLDQLCEFKNGLWKGKKEPYIHVGVIRNTNFAKGGILDDADIAYHHVEEKQYKTRKLEFGDLILEKSGGGPKQPVGRVIPFEKKEGEFSFSNFTSIIRITNKARLNYSYLHKFLYYLYEIGATEPMQRQSTGIRNLQLKEYKLIDVPLPSILEQKRIVAILDQAFADIEQTCAKTEQNLKNARELFESYLQQVFSQRGEGWVEKTLGEAVVVERGSFPRPIKNFQTNRDDGVNWIKIGDAKKGDKYITSTKEKITREGASKSRFVDVGDFILSNSMSFGRPYIMNIQGYIHDGWFVLRLPKDIDSNYFYYLLSSPYVKDQFYNLAAGAIVKNISGDLVKKAMLPFPPIEEQRSIAKKLAILAIEVEALESVYVNKTKKLDELKKSILQKAFTGELTNTEKKGASA